MNKKIIWDYFQDDMEYPKNIIDNPIPYGEVWTYVSSTFLNGFINYTDPLACFVIDRYTSPDKEEIQFKEFKGMKKDLIESILSNDFKMVHTKLNCFDDDIIILGKIDSNDELFNSFIFFWFDMDVSDCSIGKFKTSDSEEDVIQSVINWLDNEKEFNKDSEFCPGLDNGIINYTRLPLTFLKGWMKF